MTGAQEHLLFHYQLGLALSQWAHVEREVEEILAVSTPAADQTAIVAGFRSIETFRARLKFCDQTVSVRLSDPYLSEWRSLRGELEGAAKKRNQLAHRSVIVFSGKSAGRRYALVENPGPIPGTAAASLCLRDLVSIRFDFFYLALATMKLAEAIRRGRPTEPRAQRLPAPPLAKLLKEGVQMLSALP